MDAKRAKEMMLTPDGKPAGSTDRVMLLAMWAKYLHTKTELERPSIISAGMGKPTFPINPYAAKSALSYWSTLWSKSQEARHLLSSAQARTREVRESISIMDSVSDYGHPQGELPAREQMAQALNRWYPAIHFKPEHILFTVGGAGALHNIFEVINRLYPGCRIVTPFPHYSLYAGSRGRNRLHPIYVMDSPGYRLTAEALDKSIREAINLAKKDNGMPKAFLLCDPSNPLGTLIHASEAMQIAEVLRNYPDLMIILDEAYAEMCLNGQSHASLLRIAPDLKDRVILMRSATKALSSAGERMAIIATFNAEIMTELVQENIDIAGHAPKSLQIAFAEAMSRLDVVELENLAHYYKPQVQLVVDGISKIGAAMPDSEYRVEGTFYVLIDLSDLLGLPLPEVTVSALNKRGVNETDEDIAYYLLFIDGIMIAPLSYFGCDPKLGYLRITCSCGDGVLETLINRLEYRLTQARLAKQEQIKHHLYKTLQEIKQINSEKHDEILIQISHILNTSHCSQSKAIQLKQTNKILETTTLEAIRYLKRSVESKKIEAAIKIQSCFRSYLGKKILQQQKKEVDQKWKKFVDEYVTSPKIREFLYALPSSERSTFIAWKIFLKKENSTSTYNSNQVPAIALPRAKL
ncbi:MAG: hypothetical protein A3F67_07070 [Verrucomicrobia bacterium RIFCSPHIGHO2_12_FULL_41_10]|nr:MAG: hypothetical protein A3F67_07070 [Verrucomicrobia bacterium RIFCSPHIGHO2_12_FULL_41_10]